MYPENTPLAGEVKSPCASTSENDAPDWTASDKIHVRPAAEMRKAAEDYARKGFKVFPVWHVRESGYCACGKHNCKSIGKHPVTRDGYKAASADIKTVRGWWHEHPQSNIGLACYANSLAVLDVDPRNGGLEGLAELEAMHGPIASAVEAVSGGAGRHIVFALDASSLLDLPGHAGTGIDLKTKGYILAAPSNHASGGTYRWVEGKVLGTVAPSPLPAWITELKASGNGKSGSSGPTGNGQDPAFDAREAAAFAAIEAGGDPQPEETAEAEAMRDALAAERSDFATLWETGEHKGKDKSASGRRAALASRMLHHHGGQTYTARHHAALRMQWEFGGGDTDRRQAAREWAWAYKPSETGGDGGGPGAVDINAEAEEEAADKFEAIRAALATADILGLTFAEFEALANPKPAKAAPKAKGLKFETRQDIRLRSRDPVRFLVDELIEAETLFALTGDYETGKSLVALDMAHCIAYGLPWAGRKTTRAGVLYLCPEGPGGLARRQDAWHLRQAALGNEVEDGPIEVVRSAVDLFNSDDHLKEIAARVMTFEDRHGIACELVIVDTFRQSTPGADENSAKDVSAFTAKLNKMRDARKVACGYVHHSGKDAAKGASGSTALIANVDVHLVAVLKSKGGKEGELRIGKLRDGENRSPIPYRIAGHDAGVNNAGTMTRAGVVVMAEPADFGAADMEVEASTVATATAPTPASAKGAPTDEPFGAEDPRGAVVLEVVGEMAAAGGKVARREMLEPVNARLRRLKLERMEVTKLKTMLAELVDEGKLCRSGAGAGVGYALPETSGG